VVFMSENTKVGKRIAEPALTPLIPQPYTLAETARRALANLGGRK
jgi:hypothetical protein